MIKKLDFAVENVEFLEDQNDSQFATAEIEAFSSGDNLHDLKCSVETLKKTAHTIFEKPVIFEIDPSFYDFGTHNEDITIPAGFVVPDSAEYIDRPDGRMSLKVVAKIWKRYAKDFIKIFKLSNNANKSVSVEMEVFDYSKPDERGITEMLSFAYTAITVLGDFVTPASPGANMQMVSFAKDRNDYEMAYRSEFAKYSELDFSIPKGVKKNAQNGLNIRSKNGDGYTQQSVTLAENIVDSETITPEKIRQIAKYFSRKNVDRPSDKETSEWTSWQLYGGNISKLWSIKLVDEMDILDDEMLSYFDNDSPSEDGEGIKETQNMEEEKKVLELETEEIVEEVEFEAEVEDENVTMEEEAEKPEEEMAEESDEAEEEMADESDEAEEEMAEEEGEEEEMSDFMSDLMGLFGEDDPTNLFATISDKITELESENAELKEFKADVEQKRFDYEVSVVLNEVKKVLGEDVIEQARENAKEFTLENLDGWKNAVKAQAFGASKDVVEEPEEEFVKIETIFGKKQNSDSLWK